VITHFESLKYLEFLLNQYIGDNMFLPRETNLEKEDKVYRWKKSLYRCRNWNHDGTTKQKIKFVKRGFGVVTIVIIGNYGKP